jgi:hypothetical protein
MTTTFEKCTTAISASSANCFLLSAALLGIQKSQIRLGSCAMEMSELTDKAIDYILDGLENASLTKWELNFYESIKDQWIRNRRLSDRQKEILGQIWDKY